MMSLRAVTLWLATFQLLATFAGGVSRLFYYNYWNDTIRTFHCKDSPRVFHREENVVMSTRHLTYDNIEVADLSITPRFPYGKVHEKLLMNDPHTIVDLSSNCVMAPKGIATLCDWAVLLPCFFGNLNQLPRTVFVHHLMLNHFIKHILPVVPSHHKFVLVSSGTDQTLPSARGDIRFKPMKGFSDQDNGGRNWQLLTSHPQIIHWYCENHDMTHRRVSTLPLGIVEEVEGMEHVEIMSPLIPIEERPVQFLVAHRVRSGRKQWETRANVTGMCFQQQQDYTIRLALCVTPPHYSHQDGRRGIHLDLYTYIAQHVSFVVCVQGGGLDPSPKAWEAIMVGTIPIIQHSTLNDAYSQLPVVFIDDWARLFQDISRVKERLRQLRAALQPYYTDSKLRPMVLERLKTSFWMDRIYHTYEKGSPPERSILAVEF